MNAVSDGVFIDIGFTTEIGVAYQAGIPIIGLYTDSGQQGATNQKNLMRYRRLRNHIFLRQPLYSWYREEK
ncbi:hypothetical protein SAMN04488114_11834 [Carnobacterium iners]|nr:hypothetical protein SAMN04488114_11834 [Carnobacterium iners]